MKIRVKIKKLPKAKYGLSSFLGYNTQYFGDGDSEQSSEVSVKKGLSRVPRQEANLEAEGGETAYGDFNGDGMAEHYNINGPRHSEGGVPLNLPEQSFIYSDTSAMKIKDPVLLEKFGKPAKSKKSYTPAQLAKQYDINKFRGILQDPNSDKISRETAELMIKNYNEKLGALALAQEAKKGFPQGIPTPAMAYLETNGINPKELLPQQSMEEVPAMMAYGGYVPKYNPGGEIVKGKTGEREATKVEKLPGKGTSTKTISGKDAEIIYEPGAERTYQGGKAIKGSGAPKNKTAWSNSLCNRLMQGATIEQLASEGHGTVSGLKSVLADCIPQAEEKFAERETAVYIDPVTMGPENQTTTVTNQIKEEPQQEQEITEDNFEMNPVQRNYDSPWWTPDVVNFAGAATDMFRTRKYTPWAPRFEPELPDVDYLDSTRDLAAQSEQANIITQGLGQFAGPQALSARASSIQGQGAKQAADTLSRYNNANVQIANSSEAQNAQILNNAAMTNQQLQDQLYDQYTTLNQQFDNAQAAKRDNLRKYFGAGFKNASETAALNAMYPQFQTDPVTGQVLFTEGKAPNPEQASATFRNVLTHYTNLGYSPTEAIKAAKAELGLEDEEDKTPPMKKKYGGFNLGDSVFPFY